MLSQSTELRDALQANTEYFRAGIAQAGFRVLPGTHPICPVMIGDAALAVKVADAMLRKGVYVIGFSFPVVPKGEARIRTQISAAHTRADLDLAINAFAEVKKEMGLEARP
jgi:glycine C-acetyltransferase